MTKAVFDEVCKTLGVTLRDDAREDYRKLPAVFDESAQELTGMSGQTV